MLHELLHKLQSKKKKVVVLKLDFEKAYDCVRWPFLQEILLARGFDHAYVSRLMQLVSGGHTSISINGVVGPYFINGRGLKQGDPISPLLFNFVVDALAKMLDSAAAKGHITSVATNLYPNGISHLQYADDTIILVEYDELQLANLKFIIPCFEQLSGLKINLAKSEAFVLGCSPKARLRAANLLNCKLGTYPTTYLGVPISPLCLKSEAFRPT